MGRSSGCSYAEIQSEVVNSASARFSDELLRECVRSHLVSDVPFGAFLSGGVDSSTIVALMSEVLERPVRTYSVGFAGRGEELSELP